MVYCPAAPLATSISESPSKAPSQFAIFKERLIETGEFVAASRVQQRLVYKDQALGFSIPVDLIPFRGVSSSGATIAWPPRQDNVMNVAGFEEALESSVLMVIDQALIVRVASVPGITLLKLTAWGDRGRETNKDAADLYRLLAAYADAGNTDRLYDQELDLLKAAGFDMDLAGAELLGRDVARIADSQAMDQVRSFLASQSERERLASHMAQTTYEEATPAVDRLLNGFCRGFLGTA
jgi:predicted nucleotidyltransferase